MTIYRLWEVGGLRKPYDASQSPYETGMCGMKPSLRIRTQNNICETHNLSSLS